MRFPAVAGPLPTDSIVERWSRARRSKRIETRVGGGGGTGGGGEGGGGGEREVGGGETRKVKARHISLMSSIVQGKIFGKYKEEEIEEDVFFRKVF
jgi:hypothetical protein